MKKRIILSFLLTFCCLCAFIPKASAEAASEDIKVLSETEIDALFVEHAVDLGHWDFQNGCFVPGTAVDYMCKKNNAGVVIFPGFKPLAVGDNISGKTIYIYNVNGQIGDFINGVSSANYEYKVFTSVGDYAVFAMGSAPIVQSELLTGTTMFHKIKAPKEISIIKSVDPFISNGCSLFYTYEKVPQITNESPALDSTLETKSSWWKENSLSLIVGAVICIVVIGFLIVIKKI